MLGAALLIVLASSPAVAAEGVPEPSVTAVPVTSAPVAAAPVAAAPVTSAPKDQPAGPSTATLRFFNRDIATLRAAYFGSSPADRAATGSQRIRDAVFKGGPGVVKMVRTNEGLTVTVDGHYVFRILAPDLDADDGQTFEEAEVVVGTRLEKAIAAARQAMQGEALLRGFGLGLAATALLGAIVWVLTRVRSWLRRRIDLSLERRLHLGLEERAGMMRLVRTFGQIVFVVVLALLVEEWLRFVFAQFPYTRPWADHLTGFVWGDVQQVWTGIVGAVPGLVMVAVIAALAHLAMKIVKTVARGIERGRYRIFGIDADVVQPTRRLITAAIWLFALAMAYPYLPGSSSEAFKGLSVLVGVMVSLGASGFVGQAAGGFILTFARALRPGEWVRIGDVEGAVVSVGVFSTKIHTYNDEEVSIPNNVVLGTVTKNFSRASAGGGAILQASVTVGYSAPWRQVHAMLLEAATRTPELERHPAPDVLQTALSDFYVEYVLRVRLRNQLRRPAVLSALNANVQDVFNEYGVQIMSPHYLSDPATPVVVPKTRWFEPPAASDAGSLGPGAFGPGKEAPRS